MCNKKYMYKLFVYLVVKNLMYQNINYLCFIFKYLTIKITK